MRGPYALAIVCFLAVPFGASTVGCSDDEPAPAGDSGASIVPDGGTTVPEGAAAPTDSATTTQDSGKKPFGEKCDNDAECESGACFSGGKQSYCSMKCTMASAATDCPKPPTTGECNNQGYCKR